MEELNLIPMQTLLYLAQIVWSCIIQERSVKFHHIRMNMMPSRMSLLSEVPVCGRTSILMKNISSYLMRLCGWGMPSHSLINPNQLLAFVTLVQDNPYHTDPLGITPPPPPPPPYNLEIPLHTAGTINLC